MAPTSEISKTLLETYEQTIIAMGTNTVKVRQCIFCGCLLDKRNRSKEHIFPQWLQEHLTLKLQAIYPTLYSATGKSEKYREMTFHGFVSGLVCRQCNNGWMSALEDEAKPILLGLVDGSWAGDLMSEASRVLARWSLKTALTIHSASSQDLFVPIEHYRMVLAGDIPETVVVAAARIQTQGDYFWIQSQNWYSKSDDLTVDDFRRTYRFTMQFGQLAVRVHYWPLRPRDMYEHFAECIVYPWYSGPKLVVWPPSGRLSVLQELDESLWINRNQDAAR